MPLRDVSFPLCILDHRSTDHPGYHMGQKGKDGKSKKFGPLGIIFIIATVSSILYLPG